MTLDNPLEVQGLLKLDRFFPDCALGLIELTARLRFGIPDLKKVWFGNTFEYKAPRGPSWLASDGVTLAGSLSVLGGTRDLAIERLEKLYGISVERRHFAVLDDLVEAVESELASGAPAMVMLDKTLLLKTGGAESEPEPHIVAVVGIDGARRQLRVLEQVRGEISLEFSEFEESFRRFRAVQRDVILLGCSRVEGHQELPLEATALHGWIHRTLENLRSADPTYGLSALKESAFDFAKIVELEKRPFRIPGQWIFSHERHTLRAALPHWERCGVLNGTTSRALNEALKMSFAHWFQLDMTIERAIHEQDLNSMRTASALLFDALPREERIADIFESLVSVKNAPLKESYVHG